MKRTTLLTAALTLAFIFTTTPAQAMRDPIGYADVANLYEYAISRPTLAIAPQGLASMKIEIMPGWYEIDDLDSYGQARWAIRFDTEECVCNKESNK